MKYLIFCLLLVCTVSVVARSVWAQAPAQVAINTEIADSEAQAGDILSISEGGLVRSAVSYDSQIVGVIVEAPIISVQPRDENTKAVSSSGSVQVRVNDSNGEIVIGDFITSSAQAGVGMKATESGYVIGKAMSAPDGESGLVTVALEIGHRQTWPSLGAGGFLNSLISDGGRLRLILAAILGIIVLIVGTISFLRVVNSGVLAIGRNPLAKGSIIRGMVISGSVVVVFMGAGLAVSVVVILWGGRG